MVEGACLISSRRNGKASLAGARWARGRLKIREVQRARSHRDLWAILRVVRASGQLADA